ncbi:MULTISPECIES: rhomboid family intramembrane serine protease [Aestuariimicrobium]|uniref:rhomboid family intramembrane serine protease n=1 Tax=Aestuariimicrobium TaxID=396388 RepID=UPI0003B4B8D2|nr:MULTISPECIES: rhomboid family intramembrane serine protease [Aestuariimicrobium]CAI9399670.1 hypothetical protein AESSP_00238 [Aestuariimicrobium sp. T2.26MG-19.2B]
MSHQRQDFRFSTAPAENRVTLALVGAVVLVAVACSFTPLAQYLVVGSHPALAWEFWRPVLYAFTSSGLIQAAINGVILYLMGRGLENELGGAHLAGAFVLCGLGGATAMTVLGPPVALDGAICGVFGIVAGYAVLKYRAQHDIRADIILLTLMVVYSIVVGSQNWIGELGGIAVGVGLGALFAYSPWSKRASRLKLGAIGVALLCLALMGATWALGA